MCVVSAAEHGKAVEAGFDGPLAVARDHTNVEDVLGALTEKGLTPDRFRTVCTEDEFALVTAAVLNALAGSPSADALPLAVPVALALRDKAVQKHLIRAAGVPTARCRRFTDLAAVREGVRSAELVPPFVIKPLAGAAAQHTHVVESSDADTALKEIASGGAQVGPWLVEEYVPGEELHVDGAIRGGEIQVLSVSRYLHQVITVHDGHLVASATLDDTDPLVARAHRLTERSLAALGHTDGVFHLEAFVDGERLVFGECAGRIGGGLILDAVRAKHGVDLYHAWAAAVLGCPSPAPVPVDGRRADSFGWVNLPAPTGRLLNLPTRDEIEARPRVVLGQTWAAAGDILSDPRRASHLLVAKALVRAPSEAEVRAGLREVGEWFAGRVTVSPVGGDDA
ncbi:ATP-grasp domain-containing protein [Streptomyces profundus]|uniref:ATP-grasp domain-containing protein n=1 Tax=Streptomyces profundus TaxID=2867410 RepID=UPI001D16DF01|nr:ATP-grasp domain-containing protein [Streptomyces sp. MA3_2.13]UED86563.1 ATP-grasp domain-containing protein [Streptomyces sp. MA3_2.13]